MTLPQGHFDFGPTKNHRPDLDDVLTEDVFEGGEGDNTRFAAIGKVIGGLLVQARMGKISLDEARSAAYAWMQVHMKPPLSEASFNNHWFRLLEREQASKGVIVAPPTLPPPKAMVAQTELGLREWAAHRWTRDEPKPRQFLVDGLILAGKPHLVVAEGGAGKTFAMLDLGLKVAAWEEDGEPLTWWGQPIRQGGTVVMLTTEDDDGHLVSRPMSTREMDAAGDIWFFTSEDTEKVDEARTHRDVGLSYCDAKGMRYVSVAGTASIVHDKGKMAELYSPSLDVWFEDGLETPGIVLLKVTPKVTEFWEPSKGKIAMAAGMLKALVSKDTPDDDIMNHGKISC